MGRRSGVVFLEACFGVWVLFWGSRQGDPWPAHPRRPASKSPQNKNPHSKSLLRHSLSWGGKARAKEKSRDKKQQLKSQIQSYTIG